MFADVELPLTLDPALTLPADAVIRSGRRTTVFVERGEGFFEPRAVETGWRLGGRVEIVSGLSEGEKVALSGVFLLDSESRLQSIAEGVADETDREPAPDHDLIRIIDFSVKNRLLVFALVAAAVIAGWWSMNRVPLDAIPDLSDTQVIIYSRWDRSPDIIEDQVTYPIVTAMLGAPGSRPSAASPISAIPTSMSSSRTGRTSTGPGRGPSSIFPGSVRGCPQGVKTELGPDATGLGLGLPVRPGRRVRAAQPGRAPLLPGLVSCAIT